MEKEILIMWEKPQKILTTDDWKSISACGTPPGVYTPNMSEEDMLKWKGTLKGKTTNKPYVELRKTFKKNNNKKYPFNENMYSQVLIVVSIKNYNDMNDANIIISMNGKSGMSFKELEDLNQVINEARNLLKILKK